MESLQGSSSTRILGRFQRIDTRQLATGTTSNKTEISESKSVPVHVER